MAYSKVQLTGGGFQDSEGNALALGYLELKLSQDCSVPATANVCAGVVITINLDSNGNAVAGQFVWGNDVLQPTNNFYKVTGFTATGQLAWGPNNQQIEGSGTFNLGTWVPNTVISWFPTLQQPLTLEVNTIPAKSQTLLNLTGSSSISIIDQGNGVIQFFGGTSTTFEVNGTPLASSSVVNFTGGTGITITNPSAGVVQVTNSAPGASFAGGGSGAYFIGPGIMDLGMIYSGQTWEQSTVNLANGSLTANQLTVYLFELTAQFTIHTASAIATNNTGGVHGFSGIYTVAGAKVLDSGAFVALTGPGVQTNNVNSGTPVTLTPGLYWHAQAADSASGGVTFSPGIGLSSGVQSVVLASLLKNATRVAIAANPLVGGVLPATLGALTPFTPSSVNGDTVFCPVYE